MGKSVFEDKKCFDFNKAIKLCSKASIISFDIFDTLVKRNVNKPEDIFKFLDKHANELGIKNFSKDRIEIAKVLFDNNSFTTLEDIYKSLENKYEKNLEELKKIEIEYELSYCQTNYEVKKLYDYCINNNKKIIAISDMYLPYEVIQKILNKSGYNIEKVYISCECNAKKSDGTLFKHVLKSEKIESKDVVHIGDNYKCDILGGLKQGIKTIRIKENNFFNNKKFYKEIAEKNKYVHYNKLINNNISKCENYYEKFGYAILGPLIYNYCYWLHENCQKNNIDKICFFSRDGYPIMNIFNLIFKNQYDTHYIYISRRALRIPYITKHNEYKNVIKFFPESKLLNIKVFFENLGLDYKNYKELIQEFDISINENIYYKDLFIDKKYKLIYERVKEDVIKNANKELDILKNYFKQENFNGKVAAVDVGWHNSMQFYIEQLFSEKELDIYGYYVGLQQKTKQVRNSEGYITDSVNGIYADSSLSFIGLIESVFLAQEGSTKRYIMDKEKTIPELYDYEYDKKGIEYEAFIKMQVGVKKFIEHTQQLKSFDDFLLSGYDSYIPLKTFGINPYYNDILKFCDFRYYSEEIVYFAKTKNLIEYIISPKQFVEDFYKSRWKIGFAKKLLRINLPYYLFYKKLKGIKE